MREIELVIPLELTASRMRRVNASIDADGSNALALELHRIVETYRQLYSVRPVCEDYAEFEEADVVETILRYALGITPEKPDVASEESGWLAEAFVEWTVMSFTTAICNCATKSVAATSKIYARYVNECVARIIAVVKRFRKKGSRLVGGLGSGRPSSGGRDKVEECRSLDVNRLHREGCLGPDGPGSGSGRETASKSLRSTCAVNLIGCVSATAFASWAAIGRTSRRASG